jgi:predicted nucleic acid-binding protein
MIVLDTNVVSETQKPRPNPRVLAWLDDQVAETLYITAISYSEILVGIEMLPDGKRKQGLGAAMAQVLEHLFASRVLAFDQQAAVEYARIYSRTKKTATLSMADAQIAAIAAAHGFAIATREVDPFRAAGLKVMNPWEL